MSFALSVLLGVAAPFRLTAQVTTPPQAMDRAVVYLSSQIVGLGEAMPDEHYNSAPNKGTSTFAQQLKHVAINNFLSAAIIMKQPPPAIAGEAPMIQGKEAVVNYLRVSFEEVRRAIADMEKGDAMELVKSGERMVPRLSVSIGIVAHGWNHYGQATQYLRAVGVVPPASR